MRPCLALAGLAILAVPLVQVLGLQPAGASPPPCPDIHTTDFIVSYWDVNNAAGVQAPVQLRKTGTTCAGSGSEAGADASFIGLENRAGTALVQIGFYHQYDYTVDHGIYCRFWQTYPVGDPHPYKCGDDTGSTYVYFRIKEYYAPPPDAAYYYEIQDCGADGYATCTTKDASQLAFTNTFGAIVGAEEHYGTGCFDQIMGSSSSPVNIGTSVNEIKFQGSVGGPFAVKSLDPSSAQCNHYEAAFSDSIVSTWDDRN